MTPTTEELVNRLRESCPATQDMESTEICDNYTEAADTIESLAARVVALEEVVKVATEALAEIDDKTNWEINPSNYDHDDVCNMNSDWCEIGNIAQAARAKLEDRA